MNNPVFSIVIPVYNVENYLDRCVRSIINQTYTNIEIILVDDGSTDKSAKLCDDYAEQDSRIIVIHKENGGLSDARNKGLKCARGNYVLFVDSDDDIELYTCEMFLPYTDHGYDIIAGNGISNSKSIKLVQKPDAREYSGKDYMKIALQRGSLPAEAWLYVYKRSFLLSYDLWFKRGILHEDEQFTPRAILCATRIINSQISFYHYVVREGSISTTKDFRKNAADFYDTCIELEKIYVKVKERVLRHLLRDSLVVKYLSLYQRGGLYMFGNGFSHRSFVWRNAFRVKTKMKAALFCVCPALYCKINAFLKQNCL